jgi:hypothetical protein
MPIRQLKVRMMTIVLAIVALLLVLIPRISYSQPPVSSGVALPSPTPPIPTAPIGNSSATDSPCFYRQADGTIVDLSAICGTGSTATPLPSGLGRSGTGAVSGERSALANPAMNITPPNDPGVLYLSGSGGNDPAAIAASQAEKQPR